MSETSNGNPGKTEKLDIRCEQELLAELTEMKTLSGKPMAEIIRKALKRYIAAEKPRLLARLRAKLLPHSQRN